MAIAGTLPLLLLLLLLPLSSLSPAAAARIPTLPPCAQDAEFQCQDIETAIRCGALGHCLRKVWGQANADDLCQECEGIVTILTKMAKETLFKKTIQHFLEEECSKFPVRLMIPNCQHIVDEYLSLLITHFQGQIPKRICRSLGLCEDKVPLSAWEPGSQDLSEKLVPAFLENFPGRPGAHTQTLMEQKFPIPLPFCWICRTLLNKVQSVIPKSVLAVAVAQLVCGLILRCSTEEGSNLGLLPNQWTPSDPDCHLCVSVTSWASSQLPANSTERDIEKTLVSICNNPQLDWQEALGICEMELSQPLSPACAEGPSFWCSSIQAAKECHAALYCKIHGQD
uniref:Pulmonary surfactant-associated protein B n=1 Tax=Vombatus ursinus TaxID=29139 RepID=A0A4X2KSD8_VOMUR